MYYANDTFKLISFRSLVVQMNRGSYSQLMFDGFFNSGGRFVCAVRIRAFAFGDLTNRATRVGTGFRGALGTKSYSIINDDVM